MSIDYYIAGKKNRRLFHIGDHRSPLELWRLVPAAAADPELREARAFVELCAKLCRARVATRPHCYEAPDLDSWQEHAGRIATAVVAFCEEEGWDVAVVNDEEVGRVCSTAGELWPITHSVVADNESCLLCLACKVEPASNDTGLCRDCDIDELLEAMRCPDCGNVIGGEDVEIPEIAALVLDLGWVHKDDCPRRKS
jgi:hypothetical protein